MHEDWIVVLPPERGEVLAAIQSCLTLRGTGPTLTELARASGLQAPSSARHHLLRLAEQGLVQLERIGAQRRLAARTVRLTAAGERALEDYLRVRGSRFVRGDHELALDARGMEAARAVALPLDTLAVRTEGRVTIVRFHDRAERDAWAAQVLKARGG